MAVATPPVPTLTDGTVTLRALDDGDVPGVLEHLHTAVGVRREADDLPDRGRRVPVLLARHAEDRQLFRAPDVRLAVGVGPA